MKTFGLRVLGAAIGFLAGCLILAILYLLLQVFMEVFDLSRVRFRAPIGFLVLPLITLFWGFKAGPNVFEAVQRKLGMGGPWVRLLLVGPVFWTSVVFAYVFVFEPFGSYMNDREMTLVAKVVLFPIGVLWFGAWLYSAFVAEKD